MSPFDQFLYIALRPLTVNSGYFRTSTFEVEKLIVQNVNCPPAQGNRDRCRVSAKLRRVCCVRVGLGLHVPHGGDSVRAGVPDPPRQWQEPWLVQSPVLVLLPIDIACERMWFTHPFVLPAELCCQRADNRYTCFNGLSCK